MDHTAEDERAYLLRRSAQHRAAAERSADARAHDLHRRFADAYARRATAVVDQH